MGKLLIKDKEIVVPGQELADGMDYLPSSGTFRDKEKIIASQLGLVTINNRLIKLVPLAGRYIPKKNDIIIGKVADVGLSGWRIEFGWAYEGNLGLRDTSNFIERRADLTRYYDYNDYIVAKITYASGSKIVDLSTKGPGLRKLTGGNIIKIGPSKVPRTIGKQGSMISMIKEASGCKIVVGQNGWVWVSGENFEQENLAIETIKKIESEAHLEGLTERIKEFLEKKTGKKVGSGKNDL